MSTTMQSNAILFCISTCLLTLVCIPSKTSAEFTEAGEYYYPRCNTTANYTAGSVYASNLRLVLNSLVSNVSKNNGYYNTTSGTQPNIVYGQLQCRGDVTKEVCASCANTSATTILKDCPSEKAAEIHFGYCWLYYADYPFFSTQSTFPTIGLVSSIEPSDPDFFSEEVTSLMKNLTSTAASELTKFADGSVAEVVYGLVQCTPYMSNSLCLTCLQANLDKASGWFHSNDGARAISPYCYMRYESRSFFTLSPPPPQNQATDAPPPIPPISNGIEEDKEVHYISTHLNEMNPFCWEIKIYSDTLHKEKSIQPCHIP